MVNTMINGLRKVCDVLGFEKLHAHRENAVDLF